MKSLLLLSSLALTGMFASCSDDKKEDPTPTKTDSELLMAKTWTQTAETETMGTAAPIDTYTNGYEACEKDNTLKFLAGNILTFDQGATKCDPDDAQSISGNWALTDKTLTMVVFSFGGQATIQELTDSKMVLSTSETVNGTTTITRSTYIGK